MKNFPNKEFLNSNINSCKIYDLRNIKFSAGNITPLYPNIGIPFTVKRVFYIYDVPGGSYRGGHAHKTSQEFIVAVSGNFKVELNDGYKNRIIELNRPYFGLYIPQGIWATQKSFSSGAICLVLDSHNYNEEDYIRNYKLYCNLK